MEFYAKKNGEYDRVNAQSYDYSGARPEPKTIEYYETIEGTVEEENEEVEEIEEVVVEVEENEDDDDDDDKVVASAEYFEHKEDPEESNEIRHLSYEKSNEYDDYCAKCYKLKDIAGDKWEKSNGLADSARKIGIQAKRTEEKANYYKMLAIEECENANRLWEEYRGVSGESIQLMREARKYMTKFEECLRECDKGEQKCDTNCFNEEKHDSKVDNRAKPEPDNRIKQESDNRANQESDNRQRPEARQRPERRPKPDYGSNHQRR